MPWPWTLLVIWSDILALAVTRRGNVWEELLSELLHVTVRPARDRLMRETAAAA